MKKEIFEAVRDILLDTGKVTECRLWDTNSDFIGSVAFLEFSGLDYSTHTNSIQGLENGSVKVRLFCKAIGSADTEIFDVSQAVYIAMQQAGYDRLSEIPAYEVPNSTDCLIEWDITFKLPHYLDEDAKPVMQKIARPPIKVEVEVNA